MEQNRTKLTLLNLLALIAAAIAVFVVGRATHALSVYVTLPFLGVGLLVAAVSYFHMRLVERERVEQLEFDELTKSPSSSALFNSAGAETRPAARARRQFEKFFIPGFAIFLLLAEGTAVVLLWRWLGKPLAAPVTQPLLAISIVAMLWLVLFLLGRFSVALARMERQRLLSPVSSYVLADSYVLAVAAAAVGLVVAGFPSADVYVARVLVVLLGVLATELLLTLLFEIYRPRVRGKELRVLYDSRVMGVLAQPESLFTTAAHVLDYQFGFAVSQTRFFQFLQKSLAWIIVGQVAILLLSTSLVAIEPGEEALLERFGKPVAGRPVIGPGIHFKWPWPIDKVQRHRTEQVQTFRVGLEGEEDDDQTVLWTVSHSQEEFNLLVASRDLNANTNSDAARAIPPVNLLSVGIPVQFQITNLVAWAYNNARPAELLEKLAMREVVRYLVSADLNEIMSVERGGAGEALRQRIQTAANDQQLGVRIAFVGLQDVHPPLKVAGAYEKVVGALHTREARILSAKAFAVQTNAAATAQAYRTVREAESERDRLKAMALARAASFTNQIPAYRAAPTVYTERGYLDVLSRNGANTRKYVLATTNTDDVILFNLEDKLRTDLLDVQTPAPMPARK